MSGIRWLLSVVMAATMVSACLTTSPTGRPQMIWTSDEEMEAQAARAFAKMKADIPLVTNRATIDYIACVANAVVNALPMPYSELDWEMAIFDEEAINAFAMPGGKIGVFKGLLKAAQNQDQLAAVIGHEIAHVTARHSAERASRAVTTGVGIQVAAVLLGGGHRGATHTAYQALNAGAQLGLMLPFNRGQESEADVVGLEYMARAGFDPREAVPLWRNMSGANEGQSPPEFLSTHPSSDTRIDQLVGQFGKALALYNEAQAAGRRPSCVGPASG